jgi:hypothetical protein
VPLGLLIDLAKLGASGPVLGAPTGVIPNGADASGLKLPQSNAVLAVSLSGKNNALPSLVFCSVPTHIST